MARQADEQRAGALEDLVHSLGEHAREFTPDRRESAIGRTGLPDRQPGENLASKSAQSSTAATVVIDCGTSRRSGYSHVLWVSPSAESILGSHGLDKLSDAIGRLPGVSAYEWDGLDLMHLRAAGSRHGDLLDGARAAVDQILAS
ncbi:hypothetical protein [Demequina oxidasica]|uniref:hypothetical protein n=1 Tax=Demequina oxidasica TaxID=676199 RepID=UPI000780F938|nr:hypothetical protein [Demequina oxidasica]